MRPGFALLLLCPTLAAAAVRSGDANGDLERTAEDVELVITELFDGDSNRTLDLAAGAVAAANGADANDDGRVDAADLALLPALLRAPLWTERAPLPEPRQEVGVAECDGAVYVVGGLDGRARVVDTVESYDPDTGLWREVAPLPERLHHVPVAAANGKLYSLGGLGPTGFTPSALTFAYDPQTDTWTRLADQPSRRGAGAAAAIDGRIYVAGGLRGGSVADFAVFDTDTGEWTVLPPMPTARDHLGAAVVGGLFYAVAGRAGSSLFDVVEVYDPAANRWTRSVPIPTARGGLAVVALRGRIFALGGEGNPGDPLGIFHEVETFDPDLRAWEQLPPMAVGRHGIGAAALRGRIHVPGGAIVQGFGAVTTHDALLP